VLKLIPKNPEKHMKIQDIDPEWIKFNSDFTLLRSSIFTPSPTLTCRGQQMGISGVHHPLEDRKFTINEMKRLTSLPDDFKLSGTFNQKAERIGNMVPPLMIKTIAENVYLHILSK
jgi:DNA (cytosine-5)-methyltransferase 1